MVNTANSNDPNNEVSNWGGCWEGTPWNIDSGDLSSEGRATAVSEGRMPGATMYENVEDRKRVKFCGFSLSQMMSLRFCQEIRCAEQLERYTHAGITRNAKTFPRKAVKRKARGGCKVYEHPMSPGRRVYQSEERSFRSGKPQEMSSS
jgi:hypothetical protein